ncbi:hypothetical protein F503_07398 [Ophiostoma piceae UAMH 11346]|uniref:Uncharacterized protein n=1 Tax=Ophiostoma piceae (strain UAMH 11346) TaxID=1262450 RepID=S3C9T7_OPHP1|nr:hypothetical protein F503_07398 [Ophiostoma piceae UAMH 11346]
MPTAPRYAIRRDFIATPTAAAINSIGPRGTHDNSTGLDEHSSDQRTPATMQTLLARRTASATARLSLRYSRIASMSSHHHHSHAKLSIYTNTTFMTLDII